MSQVKPKSHELQPRAGFTTADRQEVEIGLTFEIQYSSPTVPYLVRRAYMRWDEAIVVLDAVDARELATQLRAEAAKEGRFDELATELEALAHELIALPYGGIA